MIDILIVDDEINIRSVLKLFLEAEGYRTVTAGNVKEAEAILSEKTFQLVTLDINLPGESGLDFLARLRAEYPTVAILMVTIIDDMSTAKRAIENGAYGYVRKPFEREDLIIGIHSALRRRDIEMARQAYQSDLEIKVSERTTELAQSEERYRKLVEKMTEGLVVIDADRIITYVNKRFCEMIEYEERDVVNRLLDDFVDEAWLDHMKTQIAKRRYGIDERYENIWCTRSKQRVHTIVSPASLFDEDGTFLGGLGVITDITDLKRTESALLKELTTSTAIAETASRLVSSVNLEEISSKILEKSVILTGSKFGFAGYVDPGTGFLVAPTLSAVVGDKCLMENKEPVFEVFSGLWGWALTNKKPILTNDAENDTRSSGLPDGHVPIKRFIGMPATLGNRVVGLIGVANADRDYIEEDMKIIHPYAALYAVAIERKWHENEARNREKNLNEILNSIAAGIMIVDLETHVITEINPTAARMIGAPKEAIVGRECWNFVCPSSTNCCPFIDKEIKMESFERVLIDVNGVEIPILKTIVPVVISGRLQYLETFLDITEQKKMESQLVQSQKLESIGQLAAGVAHEINTPTQYVGDNTRFLKEVFADLLILMEEYEELAVLAENGLPTDEAIQRIHSCVEKYDLDYLKDDIPKSIDQTLEGVDRISKIVQSMRQFAHSDQGNKIPVDLHKMIESTAIVSRNEYKYIAELKMDFDDSLPLIPCYAGELNQVILNLIVNAAHAITDKSDNLDQFKGLITISTKNKGEWAEIKVTDNGIGIPPSIHSRIFDPFFTTKEVGKGTGQGLAIAHAVIVEKHGGNFFFETEEGYGTTFFIHIPLPVEEDAEDAA